MNAQSVKNGAPTGSTRAALRQRRRYALWALIFIALGLALLVANLGLLAPGPVARAGAWQAALVIVAGLAVAAFSRAALNFAPPSFAFDREEYEAACLQVASFAADMRVGVFAGTTQLAVGQFSGEAGPGLQIDAARGHARLVFDHRAATPFISGDWSADLAKNLPWSFDLRSTLGHFTLNLRDLNVVGFRLRSLAGDADVTLPAVGQGEMDLHLTFGDLTLHLPEGMAIKIRVTRGPLADIQLDEKRFIRTGEAEWVTPYFSSSPNRFTFTLTLVTGDLTVI